MITFLICLYVLFAGFWAWKVTDKFLEFCLEANKQPPKQDLKWLFDPEPILKFCVDRGAVEFEAMKLIDEMLVNPVDTSDDLSYNNHITN